MKSAKPDGVYQDRGKLYTLNPEACRDTLVYNERLINRGTHQYRSWNPYRSKLASTLLKGQTISLTPDAHVLYLGAANGTTVSHISDILMPGSGLIYAVETSPFAMHDLLEVSQTRKNIIPILKDANRPERYQTYIDHVDFIYQDISQRNQAQILHNNISTYLQKGQEAILMVKARSIDISLRPKQAYQQVTDFLKEQGHTVHKTIDLHPYQKDHAAIVLSA